MKILSLLMWVTQFGISVVVPPCFFLWLASWAQNAYGLGNWLYAVCSLLGLLVSGIVARQNLAVMRKEAEASETKQKDKAFNDHQ